MKEETINGNGVSCGDDGSIYFEEGLFGFEDHRKFLPVAVEADSDTVLTLRSLEGDDLSFILMNPFLLAEDYNPEIPQEELADLGPVREEGDYSWYVICAARRPADQSTVNLKCPIVVNTATRRAKQVILDQKEYGFRHPLGELTRKGRGKC